MRFRDKKREERENRSLKARQDMSLNELLEISFQREHKEVYLSVWTVPDVQQGLRKLVHQTSLHATCIVYLTLFQTKPQTCHSFFYCVFSSRRAVTDHRPLDADRVQCLTS